MNKTAKRVASLTILLVTTISIALVAFARSRTEVIPAPHSVNSFDDILEIYLNPVLFENRNGPVIGVTTLQVLKLNGKYFRDSNNNGILDTFEDWRLPAYIRVADAVSRLTLEQKVSAIHNIVLLDPPASSLEYVYDEAGNVILSALIPNADEHWAFPRPTGTMGITEFYPAMIYELGLRGSVLRSEPPASIIAYETNRNVPISLVIGTKIKSEPLQKSRD